MSEKTMNVPCPVAGYENKRWCMAITVGHTDESGSHIPSIVVEDVSGHYPMTGRGEGSSPWTWGKDYSAACAVADKYNEDRLGITKEVAEEIVTSSMRASFANRR